MLGEFPGRVEPLRLLNSAALPPRQLRVAVVRTSSGLPRGQVQSSNKRSDVEVRGDDTKSGAAGDLDGAARRHDCSSVFSVGAPTFIHPSPFHVADRASAAHRSCPGTARRVRIRHA